MEILNQFQSSVCADKSLPAGGAGYQMFVFFGSLYNPVLLALLLCHAVAKPEHQAESQDVFVGALVKCDKVLFLMNAVVLIEKDRSPSLHSEMITVLFVGLSEVSHHLFILILHEGGSTFFLPLNLDYY